MINVRLNFNSKTEIHRNNRMKIISLLIYLRMNLIAKNKKLVKIFKKDSNLVFLKTELSKMIIINRTK